MCTNGYCIHQDRNIDPAPRLKKKEQWSYCIACGNMVEYYQDFCSASCESNYEYDLEDE